ncbi:hypothetical protein F4809DRAFT_640115 [Biscogniauxia mediterranea]|nr:hypothetical protein F4809DRAFT_640115 [Biscogniauxia mediterranea]
MQLSFASSQPVPDGLSWDLTNPRAIYRDGFFNIQRHPGVRCHTLSNILAVEQDSYGYAIPSEDGFPDPDAQQLLEIETEADGLLSDLPPPPTLSEAGIANFQLIAFNENFEVAFFSSLIENITNSVPGFDTPWNNWDRDATPSSRS